MRRSLGFGWSIELPGLWTPKRDSRDATTWHAPGRMMRVAPGHEWRCTDGAGIIALLDAELPPNPTGKVGEGGGGGVGHRAAWLYQHESTVYGFNFVDTTYVETVFTSTSTTDLGWAVRAWRSVTREVGNRPLNGVHPGHGTARQRSGVGQLPLVAQPGRADIDSTSLGPEVNRARKAQSGNYAAGMFREVRPGDFDQIIRLYRQLHPGDPVLEDESDAAAFQQILDSPLLQLFVLELDGVVVATTYLNVIPNITRSASPYAVIENVVVDESRRGAGLGKRIMAGTLQAAWDAGCYKAMLMTGSRKPATHAFYKACGFSADDKTAYVARPDVV
ncbi:GNAT family N-acetyltransferase [Micromonospora sp. CPCC 205539]|uniref:GNAT family N-acetyltransferase n=1 Tax=Micromonospora sp. CPCC 205539 TaxID=3122408 RepID=UPI002FF3FAD0